MEREVETGQFQHVAYCKHKPKELRAQILTPLKMFQVLFL